MGFFKKAGRKIERFKRQTTTAADEVTNDDGDMDDESEASTDEIDTDENERGNPSDSESETKG